MMLSVDACRVGADDDHRTLPVFICYRQADGLELARAAFEELHGYEYEDGTKLSVYWDQAAPAVADWRKIHLPRLMSAHAMLFIATPGAFVNEGKKDWVHAELEWWVRHRMTPPVVVDATGQDMRYIPDIIKKRWPHCQRVRLGTANDATIVNRVAQGLRYAEGKALQESIEIQRAISKAWRFMFYLCIACLVLSAVGAATTVALLRWHYKAKPHIESLMDEPARPAVD